MTLIELTCSKKSPFPVEKVHVNLSPHAIDEHCERCRSAVPEPVIAKALLLGLLEEHRKLILVPEKRIWLKAGYKPAK